ncbi:hypothetical protein KI688_000626 [Linnemannia hyalina]|uniref:PAS domain-containing protein n=1 Tax=Linnemannia hyalina TaxID=64524 RepID=A0A9P7Y4X9_9FUNG|nr:hypothetical protein KI688_000626 [Linnemannia hyalina]
MLSQEFERIRRHHEAFSFPSDAWNVWNTGELAPEARACMILNRFSRDLGVMYASPSCEFILQVDPEEIVGKPFLLFIRADDLAAFVQQADIAKSSTVMTHMRFWFQSPNCPHEVPIEAMLFGCADGMVAILRHSRPFTRKRLIGSTEHFEFVRTRGVLPLSSSLGSTSSSSLPYGSSSASSVSPSPPNVHVPNLVSRRDDDPKDFRLPRVGMRSVPMGSIENIQGLERDQSRFRPLTTVQLSDSTFEALPRGYQLREVVQIDSDEDDDDEGEEESVFRQSDDEESSYYDDEEDRLEFDDGEDEGGEHEEVFEQMENFSVVPATPEHL